MRIVIDFQAYQTPSSATRGIGRYSFALASHLVQAASDHEVIFCLNRAFPETLERVQADIEAVAPGARFVSFDVPAPTRHSDQSSTSRRLAAEVMREHFIQSLNPDVVFLSSLFEGLEDNSITSIGRSVSPDRTAATLYDLIPLINREHYLANPQTADWYMDKIESLKRSGMSLAISESSRREGIDLLGFAPERVINISSAVSESFHPIKLRAQQEADIRARYGLNRPFLMYTGGIDLRKNIEGLIASFAQLPADIRNTHQLAIVCSAHPADKQRLQQEAASLGLSGDSFVMTGYVPEEDLLALYNLCHAFCFPSWHEGFGLPALEAMKCGVPTIGSNRSSIPEVIGLQDALFDPLDTADMTRSILQVLSDDGYRQRLVEHGLEYSKRFSWQASAQRALEAFQDLHERKTHETAAKAGAGRKRLAYLSPIPPAQSGIADYSAELLPALAEHYDIDVVNNDEPTDDLTIKNRCNIIDVESFRQNFQSYDRVFYHFGNSSFHGYMFDLIKECPGVVVLHDFYVSGILNYIQNSESKDHYFTRSLYHSHGYTSLIKYAEGNNEALWQFPANLQVLQNATGTIVHSQYALSLASQRYNDATGEGMQFVELTRALPEAMDKASARRKLGLPADAIVICSFGFMSVTKCSREVLDAFLMSASAANSKVHLVFVGSLGGDPYCQEIKQVAEASPVHDRIRFTGYVNLEDFRDYLSSADIGVQLRRLSRGETSISVLDCMAYELAAITNANGSMAELPRDCVHMLDDAFDVEDLARAIDTLVKDGKQRAAMSTRARAYVANNLAPRDIARKYVGKIEDFYQSSPKIFARQCTDALEKNAAFQSELTVRRSFAVNFPPNPRQKVIFLDVSALNSDKGVLEAFPLFHLLFDGLIQSPPACSRVEPVWFNAETGVYHYARRFTLAALSLPEIGITDDPIECAVGDQLLCFDTSQAATMGSASERSRLRSAGVGIVHLIDACTPALSREWHAEITPEVRRAWLNLVFEDKHSALCITGQGVVPLAEKLASDPRWVPRPHVMELAAKTAMPKWEVEYILALLRARPTVLLPGCVEDAEWFTGLVEAFEGLWRRGEDVNLVIMGEEGWTCGALPATIRKHPEHMRRLFWLSQSPLRLLERVLAEADGLMVGKNCSDSAATLDLARRHGLPTLLPEGLRPAEDGACMSYGPGKRDLEQTLQHWLQLHRQGRHAGARKTAAEGVADWVGDLREKLDLRPLA